MTGIAWGNYKDYFTGEWDGRPHLDEGQVNARGDTLWHGRMVPYIVPTENFLRYFKERHIKRVIDAGVDHIFLEEPEFWQSAGYSDAFKREWTAFYGSPWRPQDESPEAAYLTPNSNIICTIGLWTRRLPMPRSMAGAWVGTCAAMCPRIRSSTIRSGRL